MLKILFVDDEAWVIEGLNIMIDWEELGVERVGAAEDVESAIEMINTLHPDIVITDIQMNDLSGLDMLETYSGKKYKPEFLMLTGYGELDYIRSSMKYGASRYLMKPIDPEEITESVREICERIYDKREREKEQEDVLNAVIQETFQRIIFGEQSEELYSKAAFLLGIREETPMTIVIFRAANGIAEEDYKAFFTQVKPLVHTEGMCSFSIGNKTHILISDGAATADSREIAQKGICFFTSVYIADVDGFDKLAEIYNIAVTRFRELSEEVKQVETHQLASFKITVNAENALKLAVRGNKAEAVQKIKNDLAAMKAAGSRLSQASGYAASLLISMCKYANPAGMNMESLFDDTLNAVNNAYDFDTISALCCECLEMFMDLCEKMKGISPMSITDEVVTYIKKNYAKDLTLSSLSAEFKIKVSIISKAVKTGTGMKFNDYINYVRVQNSKQKILNTNKKITQIAAEVGYNDYCYFASRFKKLTGVLPSDYRKTKT